MLPNSFSYILYMYRQRSITFLLFVYIDLHKSKLHTFPYISIIKQKHEQSLACGLATLSVQNETATVSRL